jgi:hypothetical protein
MFHGKLSKSKYSTPHHGCQANVRRAQGVCAVAPWFIIQALGIFIACCGITKHYTDTREPPPAVVVGVDAKLER